MSKIHWFAAVDAYYPLAQTPYEVFMAVGNNIYLFTTMQFDLYVFSFRAFADAGQMKQRLEYGAKVCQYCRG